MNSLTAVSWNAEGMFVEGSGTRRAQPKDAIRVIRGLSADIVVIPEFGILDRLSDYVQKELGNLGYSIHTCTYPEKRSKGLGLAVLSKLPVCQINKVPLGEHDRSMLSLIVKDTSGTCLRVMALHLDDRKESFRLTQIQKVCEYLNNSAYVPTLAMGDFNAMHKRSLFAHFMRNSLVGAAARSMPDSLTATIIERVHEMAYGTTIDFLEEFSPLHSLDTGLQRTISAKQRGLEWAPAWRLAKIDWMFGTKEFTTKSYRVLHDVGSDHRPVLSVLSYDSSDKTYTA